VVCLVEREEDLVALIKVLSQEEQEHLVKVLMVEQVIKVLVVVVLEVGQVVLVFNNKAQFHLSLYLVVLVLHRQLLGRLLLEQLVER
jgi:hypothetical protein